MSKIEYDTELPQEVLTFLQSIDTDGLPSAVTQPYLNFNPNHYVIDEKELSANQLTIPDVELHLGLFGYSLSWTGDVVKNFDFSGDNKETVVQSSVAFVRANALMSGNGDMNVSLGYVSSLAKYDLNFSPAIETGDLIAQRHYANITFNEKNHTFVAEGSSDDGSLVTQSSAESKAQSSFQVENGKVFLFCPYGYEVSSATDTKGNILDLYSTTQGDYFIKTNESRIAITWGIKKSDKQVIHATLDDKTTVDWKNLDSRIDDYLGKIRTSPNKLPAIQNLLDYIATRRQYSWSNTTESRTAQDVAQDLFSASNCSFSAVMGAGLLNTTGIPTRIASGIGYGQKSHAWVEAFVDGKWHPVEFTPPVFNSIGSTNNSSTQMSLLGTSTQPKNQVNQGPSDTTSDTESASVEPKPYIPLKTMQETNEYDRCSVVDTFQGQTVQYYYIPKDTPLSIPIEKFIHTVSAVEFYAGKSFETSQYEIDAYDSQGGSLFSVGKIPPETQIYEIMDGDDTDYNPGYRLVAPCFKDHKFMNVYKKDNPDYTLPSPSLWGAQLPLSRVITYFFQKLTGRLLVKLTTLTSGLKSPILKRLTNLLTSPLFHASA